MTPVDTGSLTGPVIAQWGAYGVILIVMAIAIVLLAKALVKSYADRLVETKENLTASLKNGADTIQALKDMKTTVDAVVGMMKARP